MAVPFTVSVDRTGFPLVETPDLPFAFLWLPITKIQFEHFLVDTEAFDNNWYQDKLRYNGRVSPYNLSVSNYWQAFMTGILPVEALRYAAWYGGNFDLPTAREWKDTFDYFARWEAEPDFIAAILQTANLSERARALIANLEVVTQQESRQLAGGKRLLCDQMAMRLGVAEIAYETHPGTSFCAWGQPNKRQYAHAFNPLYDPSPIHFVNRAEGARMAYCGFRLLRRK
jgi:hypothetical protein